MSKTSPGLPTTLHEELEKLAAFEPQGSPVISLYLNLTPDQHGRDNYEAFCRKSFTDRLKGFQEHSPERASFKRDIERINEYLANELNRPANALALFACAGAGEFFEAVQLDVPIEEHWLFIGAVPHIYPLARLIDQYPRYACVVLDTNRAHIVVFSLGAVEKQKRVTSAKTRRSSTGGWSQARYQRRAENLHLHHIKEVVDTLERIVRVDNIQHIIVSGDEVAVPLLKEALPAHVAEKIVDVIKLDRHVVEDQIAAATFDVLRDKDAEADTARVAGVLDAWRAGGLSVVGPEATMTALQMGQVEELLITASPQKLKPIQKLPENAVRPLIAAETSAPGGIDESRLQMSDEFVALANKTGARVRFIESPELLREHGGVAAMLRFRL